MTFALIHKDRKLNHGTPTDNQHHLLHNLEFAPAISALDSIETLLLVGDVRDKACILIDDLADTCYTISRASEILVNKGGATKVYALITHGILSGEAVDRINESHIDELIVSNSIPQEEHLRKSDKIKFFDVSQLIAESVRRVFNGESVSYLFDTVDF